MVRKNTTLSPLCLALLGSGIWFSAEANAFQEEAAQPATQENFPESRTIEPPNRKPENREATNRKRERPARNEGQGGGLPRGGQRDPAQMVKLMMEKFDSDGDAKLDAEELTAMLKFMRERSGQMGMMADRFALQEGQQGQGAGANRQNANRPGANRPGARGNNERQDEAGGVKPRRPPAE